MVLVNAKYKSQKVTGVQRVATELVNRLEAEDAVKCLNNKYSGILGHVFEQIILPFKIRKGDLLLSPINLGPIFVKNQVVILHDVATFDHPEWFSKGFRLYYYFMTPILLKRVKKIVTVSEYSKGRIVDIFGLANEKVVVIPNGVGQEFFCRNNEAFEEVGRKYNVEKGTYLLSVCSIEPRKNIIRMIDGWLKSKLYEKGYKLLVVGGSGKNFASIDAYLHPSIIWTGYVSDCELHSLYYGAAGFSYVSLYEGFGLPVLEAMAAGVPVLASNTTSIPEVIGEFGVLVDPTSINEIAEGFKNVVLLDDETILEAQSRAREFSWEKSSQLLMQLLKTME